MILKPLKPRIALNKAYLKIKPNRSTIELFKKNLIQLIDHSNNTESEEFHKNLVSDFLKKTYYEGHNFINTKGRNDLVIHNGPDAKSSVGVIIEAKKPTNKAEMLTLNKINVKAFQELVLYFLRERIGHKNLEIKYLIATNINEWFIFDANFFEKFFAQNKTFVKQFTDFENGTLTGKTTDFFYKEIAEPFIETIKQEIEFAHFDIRDYDKPLRNNDKVDDNKLIALFKLLSPEHILKLPFANDSNSLDKRFYGELLHIIGLVEKKDGGKKVIQRYPKGEQNTGSLLENAIIQLDSLDKINQLNNPSHFGENQDERLFNVGLELVITWINRILFLKLLEAQLIGYHKGDKSYAFLNIEKLRDYDDLNSLFFQVLAKKYDERNQDVKQAFEKVPYLNSSLFEPTGIEHATLFISNLRDDKTIPVFKSTVLKDDNGKTRTGEINALNYLFEFLNAYDFSSEGSEEIQEDNKTLINASVLGLIFEKINGYKDGSFFTPGFITMYMCRETIRRAVVQKFNEIKNWNVDSFDDLKDKIGDTKEDRIEANQIVNSIKICDPAVGSGHFLVSALNEMLAIKYELEIMQDRTSKRLKYYKVQVINDELIITDTEDGKLFDYNPKDEKAQLIQEMLFHEKQTIIENCLFGVDINPNSVKICRLRLWIELLKSAYYKNETELETLPNIDINIKCGNSLISRFGLDADLSEALEKSKLSIKEYRVAVDTYRNAENKEQKREMERLINEIKNGFQTNIDTPFKKNMANARAAVDKLSTEINTLKQWGEKIDIKIKTDLEKAKSIFAKLEKEKEDILGNKIFESAFEWRFEFPEILDDQGDFVGFDAIIGNPPYFSLEKSEINYFQFDEKYKSIEKRGDIYTLFYELGLNILRPRMNLCFITSSTWLRSNYGKSLRTTLLKYYNPSFLIDFSDYPVFDSATVLTNIIFIGKEPYSGHTKGCLIEKTMLPSSNALDEFITQKSYGIDNLNETSWSVSSISKYNIRNKIINKGITLLESGYTITNGFRTGFNEAYVIDEKIKNNLLKQDSNCIEIIKPIVRGRDLKKYQATFENLYIIIVAHGEGENLKEKYPVIYSHLSCFEKELRNRGQVKNGQHHWLELDNHPSKEYLNLFLKPKILYPEITKFLPFYLDNQDHFYSNNKTFFITGENLDSLISYLNSKLFKYIFLETFPELQGNSRELRKVFMEQIPMIKVAEETNDEFKILVSKISKCLIENPNADTKDLESEIDKLVYKLYELTDEEIKVIEESVG